MLITDNAPDHPPTTLTNFDSRVKVVFLPPNTTSLLQPMDQGVIKTFKAYYTRRSFVYLHEAMRQNNVLSVKDFWKQFNVLDAAESVPEPDEIGNVIEEVVDLARQINLEVDSDDVRELLDSHNQELTIDELIEMCEQEQDIEELDSLDPVKSEDRMTVGKLTEGLSVIEKGLQILENIDSNEERISSTKREIKKLLACYEEILWEKKNL
ncbi:tigger transposable element-derived protein 1-like [Centruroides sculpturatus]|uniref:tigger transposable element-derived protein 1-like n=1 Tax=Centruroides sculpturatus TaxID=218467 RepID=UPI000C6D8F40|nr:tigger transposable element-derived protein 1-like [Centruroides sculpturatus]